MEMDLEDNESMKDEELNLVAELDFPAPSSTSASGHNAPVPESLAPKALSSNATPSTSNTVASLSQPNPYAIIRYPTPPPDPNLLKPVELTKEYTDPKLYIDIVTPVPSGLLKVTRDEAHEEMVEMMFSADADGFEEDEGEDEDEEMEVKVEDADVGVSSPAVPEVMIHRETGADNLQEMYQKVQVQETVKLEKKKKDVKGKGKATDVWDSKKPKKATASKTFKDAKLRRTTRSKATRQAVEDTSPPPGETESERLKRLRRAAEEELIRSMDPEEKENAKEEDWRVYCVCREMYDETRSMIQCDRCDGWFHLECCAVDEDTVELIDQFVCPECSNDEFHTTFREKCLRNGCSKPREYLSKYCSAYCGTEVAALKLLESGIEPMRLWEVVKGARAVNSSVRKEVKVMAEKVNGEVIESDGEAEEEGDIHRLETLKKKVEEVQERKMAQQKRIEQVSARLQFLQIAIRRWDSLYLTTLEAIKAAGGILPEDEDIEQIPVGKKGKKKKSGKTKKGQGNARDEAPCGFDVRLVWSDREFDAWVESEEGKQALAWKEGVTEEGREGGEGYTCLLPKKKCTRHDGWKEIREADFEVEKSVLARALERLQHQEKVAKMRLDEFREHMDFEKNVKVLLKKQRERSLNSKLEQPIP